MKKIFNLFLIVFCLFVVFMTTGCKQTIDDLYDYEVNSFGNLIITRYKGKEKEVVIPEFINEVEVKEYKMGAFNNCKSIRKVVIPNNIEAINGCLFSGCTNLVEVVLPSNLKYICFFAFENCTSLKNIILPDTILEIQRGAFSGCTSLENVTLPKNITTLFNIFQGCTNLKEIKIPSSVETITSNAFYDCKSLTSIVIPKNVIDIDSNIFGGCTSLKEVIVEEGNPVYDSRNNCNAIIETETNTLIAGCGVSTIPNDIKIINDRAFENVNNLTSITITASVEKIGYAAFRGCTSLKKIFIPKELKEIGESAFIECGLEEIKVEEGNPTYDSRNNCNAIIKTSENKIIRGCTNTTFPNDVKTIDSRAFSICPGLKELVIPKTITKINNIAFVNMADLEKVTVEAGNPVYDSRENCNGIIETKSNKMIFGFEKTTFPKSVTTIGSGAFSNNMKLTSLVIPDTITTIEGIAFSNTAIKEIKFPKNITKLSEGLFNECESLTEFVVPNTVTEIEFGVFRACTNMKKLVIPESVQTIRESIATGDSNLTIYCEHKTKPEGFVENWAYNQQINGDEGPVVWGYKIK